LASPLCGSGVSLLEVPPLALRAARGTLALISRAVVEDTTLVQTEKSFLSADFFGSGKGQRQ
jgi:hypothetical protein